MSNSREDILMNAWKQQLDMGLRVTVAALETVVRISEAQLGAAVEAHASFLAMQRALQDARDPVELMQIQAEWMRANMGRAVAYWRSIFQSAMPGNFQSAMQPMAEPPQAPAGPEIDSSSRALAAMMENAYKQWLDASRQFYKGSNPSSSTGLGA
jgi:hypothetical protein